MEIAIINEELFKTNGPIKDDVIITKFVPYIILAQKMYIRPIIGVPLYTELQAQIKAASVTPAPEPNPITPANQALIIEIAPALSSFAVYQGLPFHWAAIQNKGITLRESENSDAVSVNDIAQLRRWLKDDAERWAQFLMEYLSSCTTYPLYNPAEGCGCGPANAIKAALNETGINIPSKFRR